MMIEECSDRTVCDERDPSGKKCVDFEFCVEEPIEEN